MQTVFQTDGWALTQVPRAERFIVKSSWRLRRSYGMGQYISQDYDSATILIFSPARLVSLSSPLLLKDQSRSWMPTSLPPRMVPSSSSVAAIPRPLLLSMMRRTS